MGQTGYSITAYMQKVLLSVSLFQQHSHNVWVPPHMAISSLAETSWQLLLNSHNLSCTLLYTKATHMVLKLAI